jgi:hypothetical protein
MTTRDGSTAWKDIEVIHQKLAWARSGTDGGQALSDIEQATRSIEAAIAGIVPRPGAPRSHRHRITLMGDGRLVDAQGREWDYVADRSDGWKEHEVPEWPGCLACGEKIDIVVKPYFAHEIQADDDRPENLDENSAAVESGGLAYLNYFHKFLHASPLCVALGTA